MKITPAFMYMIIVSVIYLLVALIDWYLGTPVELIFVQIGYAIVLSIPLIFPPVATKLGLFK